MSVIGAEILCYDIISVSLSTNMFFNKCIMVSYKGFEGNLHEPSCSEQEFKEIVIDAMNVAIDYCSRFGVERSNAIDIWEHSYESCVYK